MEIGTLRIKQGDTLMFTDTVDTLESLAGYSAKAYIYDKTNKAIDTLEGTIEGLVVTYEAKNDDTKEYPTGKHSIECKVWDTEDNVFSTSDAILIVDPTINNEPAT